MRGNHRGGSIGPGPIRGVSTSLNHPEPSDPDDRQRLGPLAEFPDGAFSEREVRVDGELTSLIVHRDGGRIRAWYNVCPHAGRRLDWSPGRFLRSKEGWLICAVHGATFEPADGVCIAGPCKGDRLRAVTIAIEGEEVFIDAANGTAD
jgi:nitrite reductase/ring-hydroxylating ferredoxin subunit